MQEIEQWWETRDDGYYCKKDGTKLTPAYRVAGCQSGTFAGPLLECVKCRNWIDLNEIP